MLLTQKLKLHCQLTDLLKRVRKLEQYYKSYKIGKVEPEKKIGLDVRIYNCNGCDLVIDTHFSKWSQSTTQILIGGL